MNKTYIVIIVCILQLSLFSSCETYKNVPYFKDVSDSARLQIQTVSYKQLIIQKDDILSVNIQTIDPDGNAIFNQSSVASATTGASSTGSPMTQLGSVLGYKPDASGEIELPLIGKFNAVGITTNELKDSIESRVSLFYKNPVVSVRFANLKVNVMGEVSRPGMYLLSNEKNTILDALSMAGDLTIFGKRENVLLIRDSAGITKMTRFNLNSKDIVKQDFFYLKQNDVIYVEPNKGKAAALDSYTARYYVIGASLISLLIVISSRL